MTHPGRIIGEAIKGLGYEILGGQTLMPHADKIDLIGVMERVTRKKRAMERPDTFYGRQIALVRAHGNPIIIVIFAVRDMDRMVVLKSKLVEAGLRVRIDLQIDKDTGTARRQKAREIRFE